MTKFSITHLKETAPTGQKRGQIPPVNEGRKRTEAALCAADVTVPWVPRCSTLS